jgi:hypothetical protein
MDLSTVGKWHLPKDLRVKLQAMKTSSMARVLCIDLDSQSYSGPAGGRGAYTSFSVLDPAITIERHGGKYHVTARFNLETNILRYSVLKR